MIFSRYSGDAVPREAMKMRGCLLVADITIFDPEKVTDNSTYKMGEQGLPTTGIPYVIVNGQMVVKNSEFQKGVWAGRPIRYPLEEKGWFESVSVKEWIHDYGIPTMSVDDCPAKPGESNVH